MRLARRALSICRRRALLVPPAPSGARRRGAICCRAAAGQGLPRGEPVPRRAGRVQARRFGVRAHSHGRCREQGRRAQRRWDRWQGRAISLAATATDEGADRAWRRATSWLDEQPHDFGWEDGVESEGGWAAYLSAPATCEPGVAGRLGAGVWVGLAVGYWLTHKWVRLAAFSIQNH